jgi:multidrug resistance efflux pump
VRCFFEIDSAPEQAALGSLQSMRPMRESDVEFAQQQVARNKTLLSAGAISQREVEQFEAQLRAAERSSRRSTNRFASSAASSITTA